MLHYSTYIYPVVFTYKTCQNIIFFGLENGHFYIQVYFGKRMFCYFIDIRALSYYANDVHIVNISNGNSIYHVLWYYIEYWHTLKEGQVTLDRSPEFLFKASYLYVSIKNWPRSGEPLVGPFLSPELYLEQIFIWSIHWVISGIKTEWFQTRRLVCFNL